MTINNDDDPVETQNFASLQNKKQFNFLSIQKKAYICTLKK